jgi:predicted RNA-binding Zn ribbon-like protein
MMEHETWTPHRFSGGLLVLDVCNSVILRHEPAKRKDLFSDETALNAYPAAARAHCAERDLSRSVAQVGDAARLFALREAAEANFRACVEGRAGRLVLAGLLDAASASLKHAPPSSLETATAMSALRLLGLKEAERLKACPACGWLFHDVSKNRSRMWCDMAVCGNRAKARRFYAAHKSVQ